MSFTARLIACLQFLCVSNCSCSMWPRLVLFCSCAAERKKHRGEAECTERFTSFSWNSILSEVRCIFHLVSIRSHWDWRARRLQTLHCELPSVISTSPLWMCANKTAGVLSGWNEKNHNFLITNPNKPSETVCRPFHAPCNSSRNDFTLSAHPADVLQIMLSLFS